MLVDSVGLVVEFTNVHLRCLMQQFDQPRSSNQLHSPAFKTAFAPVQDYRRGKQEMSLEFFGKECVKQHFVRQSWNDNIFICLTWTIMDQTIQKASRNTWVWEFSRGNQRCISFQRRHGIRHDFEDRGILARTCSFFQIETILRKNCRLDPGRLRNRSFCWNTRLHRSPRLGFEPWPCHRTHGSSTGIWLHSVRWTASSPLSQGDSNRIGALSDQVKRLEEGGAGRRSTLLGLNGRPNGHVKAVLQQDCMRYGLHERSTMKGGPWENSWGLHFGHWHWCTGGKSIRCWRAVSPRTGDDRFGLL